MGDCESQERRGQRIPVLFDAEDGLLQQTCAPDIEQLAQVQSAWQEGFLRQGKARARAVASWVRESVGETEDADWICHEAHEVTAAVYISPAFVCDIV